MRLTTIAGVAALALSTAALAQVVRTPVEQKNAPTNAAADEAAANTIGNTPIANEAPVSPDTKTESAVPRR